MKYYILIKTGKNAEIMGIYETIAMALSRCTTYLNHLGLEPTLLTNMNESLDIGGFLEYEAKHPNSDSIYNYEFFYQPIFSDDLNPAHTYMRLDILLERNSN